MKFFTIENSEGVFSLNINDITSLNKIKAKNFRWSGGPHDGEHYNQQEAYFIYVNTKHFSITKKEYVQIMKMIVDNE